MLCLGNENSFIPNLVLRPEYRTLFDYQGFILQGLHRMGLFVMFDLAKHTDLLLGPLPPLNCDNEGRIKLKHYVVNNTHSDPLQKLYTSKYVVLSAEHAQNCLSTLK